MCDETQDRPVFWDSKVNGAVRSEVACKGSMWLSKELHRDFLLKAIGSRRRSSNHAVKLLLLQHFTGCVGRNSGTGSREIS